STTRPSPAASPCPAQPKPRKKTKCLVILHRPISPICHAIFLIPIAPLGLHPEIETGAREQRQPAPNGAHRNARRKIVAPRFNFETDAPCYTSGTTAIA